MPTPTPTDQSNNLYTRGSYFYYSNLGRTYSTIPINTLCSSCHTQPARLSRPGPSHTSYLPSQLVCTLCDANSPIGESVLGIYIKILQLPSTVPKANRVYAILANPTREGAD